MACNGGGNNDEAKTASEEGDESITLNTGVFPANFADMVASLPQGSHGPIFPSLRQYRGFWLPTGFVLNLPTLHAAFEKRPADILLASFPKSGTTWLKALAFAAARRSVHSPFDGVRHPLLSRISHDCVRFIDTLRFLDDDDDEHTDTTAAPRLLGTHLPYSLLPKRARAADGGGCRIVYISRDPKDTLVSLWHFGPAVTKSADGEGSTQRQPPSAAAAAALEFEEAFELYCQGQCGLGPQWEHVREYWEASKRSPGTVLFLRYEEMLQDPAGNLKKLAEFMGCPFTAAEEDAGVVRAILELCSLDTQRNLSVNRTGAFKPYARGRSVMVENRFFFRKGAVGDWRNHMTPEMAARLDGVVEEALKGSGFTFGIAK
ncbi:hypothetical protein U9M48_033881 [Paspalum notatum var. saurae]|uniref:Sulfotransferase n=1 Tax=Paspalum notatum var. saurae TaxID=547442 RepID=A0AAQ3UBC5_PASNO